MIEVESEDALVARTKDFVRRQCAERQVLRHGRCEADAVFADEHGLIFRAAAEIWGRDRLHRRGRPKDRAGGPWSLGQVAGESC